MTGWTREELLEWGCWKRLVIEEDMPLFEKQVTGLAPGTSSACELRIHDREGRVRWLAAHSEVEESAEDPAVHRLHGACQDITERKLAEAELVSSHDLLLNLARLVPGVVYQYRLYPDGRSAFPYASPGMNGIYEVTPAEVREDATAVFGRLHPDDRDRVAEAIQESARTLDEFYCEFRVVLPRQGLRWRWSQAHPERTEDGGTLWHGIISDITERKVAEDALRESEERFEGFAAHFPGYLFMQDEGLRYVYVNQHDAKDGHVPRGAWLGKTPSQLWEGEHAARAEVRVQRALDGEVVDVVERWAPPGVDEYLHTIYFPVPRQGRAPLAGGLSLDVTEQVEA
jgi:PAS domain S-box-containing protein